MTSKSGQRSRFVRHRALPEWTKGRSFAWKLLRESAAASGSYESFVTKNQLYMPGVDGGLLSKDGGEAGPDEFGWLDCGELC